MSQLQRFLSGLIKDPDRLSQILQQISQTANNVPRQMWLWERYSRFIAMYDVLEEVSR